MNESDSANPQARASLTLAALGVVFGDIGTSPLYAVKLVFHPEHGIPLNSVNILGVASTIFWVLMIVVTIKYVILILRADNHGEGGIMALVALALSATKKHQRLQNLIVLSGLCGAALFFGDAVLTPAISVLSAIEGLEIGAVDLKPVVLPISICVLLALFSLQHFGTASVGKLFGPVMSIWFLALLVGGIANIVCNPSILEALNPLHALFFLTKNGVASFLILGVVLLVFTGAEALYADMGHFGRKPIRLAWIGLVFPALTINYFGQGAILMADSVAVINPFYRMYPSWALYPMVLLATSATVIASQACISGTFSLTKQAIQLGYLPRMTVKHTSSKLIGQIYIPVINWLLMLMVSVAILGFETSTNLAAAYGISVSGAMLLTTFIASFVYRYHWHYSLLLCLFGAALFICIDLIFFSSSLSKISHGGWFPLVLGFIATLLMITWRDGKKALSRRLLTREIKLTQFLPNLLRKPPVRVPGTAIFFTARPLYVPHAFLHNLTHNKVLHHRIVFLTVKIAETPRVSNEKRYYLHRLEKNCYRLILQYGFMEHPNIEQALLEMSEYCKMQINLDQTSFFLSREAVVPLEEVPSGMARWRELLFTTMVRNAGSAVEYYRIPSSRVIELGTRVEI
ncbi:potassium transporter Kup [Microbulbifer variabilis]|uniref:potassium transporter Kup n=1 Tax=Microbulbifer variabilis TaxID=266805 RepID=UPI001CFECE12|nr:potassium transporter Kup [Microbulbifer variabilis]